MKKLMLGLCVALFLGVGAFAQLTFFMVDNFEDGVFSKWYVFDNAKVSITANPAKADNDSIGDACGEKSLKITGHTDNWYVGGMGTNLDVDGADYNRFIMDIYGSKKQGKVKIELFEKKTAASTEEVKWIVEVPVIGEGFTRYSIPLSSFSSDDAQKSFYHGKKGGRISKLQLIYVASAEKGDIDLTIDNLIFTF